MSQLIIEKNLDLKTTRLSSHLSGATASGQSLCPFLYGKVSPVSVLLSGILKGFFPVLIVSSKM